MRFRVKFNVKIKFKVRVRVILSCLALWLCFSDLVVSPLSRQDEN